MRTRIRFAASTISFGFPAMVHTPKERRSDLKQVHSNTAIKMRQRPNSRLPANQIHCHTE